MRVRGLASLMLLWTAAAQPQSTTNVEHIAPPSDSKFVLGFVASSPSEMLEFVPRGETVEAWTRIVTVQRFPYRVGQTSESLLTRWAALMKANCPDALVDAVMAAPAGARNGARARIVCPRNPRTGRPETTFARVVLGDMGFHMVQAASRNVSIDADGRWAEGVIAGAMFCTETDRSTRCSTSRALGRPL